MLQVPSRDEMPTAEHQPVSGEQAWRQVNLQHSSGRYMVFFSNVFLHRTVDLMKLFHTENLEKKE